MNRTLQSLLAFPAAVITYIITGIICSVLPYLLDLMSKLNYVRSMGQQPYMIEFIYYWIILFLIYSILPVFSANFVMNLILENEDSPRMKAMPKVIFSVFGVLFFMLATAATIASDQATTAVIAGYMLSIFSFVAVPIYLSHSK